MALVSVALCWSSCGPFGVWLGAGIREFGAWARASFYPVSWFSGAVLVAAPALWVAYLESFAAAGGRWLYFAFSGLLPHRFGGLSAASRRFC